MGENAPQKIVITYRKFFVHLKKKNTKLLSFKSKFLRKCNKKVLNLINFKQK